MLGQVTKFVEEKGLQKHMRLFKTAALVAHKPDDFTSLNLFVTSRLAQIDTSLCLLEQEELEALEHEHTRRFKHPRELYWTIVVYCIGAVVQYVVLIPWLEYMNIKFLIEAGSKLAPTAPTSSSRRISIYLRPKKVMRVAMIGWWG